VRLIIIVNAKFGAKTEIDNWILAIGELFLNPVENPVKVMVAVLGGRWQYAKVVNTYLRRSEIALIVPGAIEDGGAHQGSVS
jgi:hypothetical protein